MNESPSPSEVQAEVARKNQQVRVLAKSVQLIWFFAGVIQALLALRIVLKALGANLEAGLTLFVYNVTDILMLPFAGLAPAPSAGGSVIELSVIIAMVVYALVTTGIVRLLFILFQP